MLVFERRGKQKTSTAVWCRCVWLKEENSRHAGSQNQSTAESPPIKRILWSENRFDQYRWFEKTLMRTMEGLERAWASLTPLNRALGTTRPPKEGEVPGLYSHHCWRFYGIGEKWCTPRKWDLRRDQALSIWNGSTDSKTLDYQRTNAMEYQIVRTPTKETTWIQDPTSPNHQ